MSENCDTKLMAHCDRCNLLFDPTEESHGAFIFVGFDVPTRRPRAMTRYDLCHACSAELHDAYLLAADERRRVRG